MIVSPTMYLKERKRACRNACLSITLCSCQVLQILRPRGRKGGHSRALLWFHVFTAASQLACLQHTSYLSSFSMWLCFALTSSCPWGKERGRAAWPCSVRSSDLVLMCTCSSLPWRNVICFSDLHLSVFLLESRESKSCWFSDVLWLYHLLDV